MAKKQIPSDIRYWEKRRELEDKARLKMEDDTIKSLTSNLTEALEKIQAQLLSQADLHNMTQKELLEDYSLRDQKKYKKYIDENYKELMKSDEAYQEFIDEFFPSYDYAKVNRLLQIRSDIFSTLASEMIKTDPNKKFNDGLEDIINKMYNSNSNALMYLLGPGDFNPLPKKELDNMLNYPWSGKTFSNRLWGNISRLEQNLSNAIVNSVSSGQGVAEALKTMKNDSSISDMFKLEEKKFKNAIENLVRTEYAHFAVTGLRKSMSDAGIKDTQSWSAEDERVCSICGGRHGKVIKDDWHPPYHGKCRCTEIPKMPELGEDIDLLYDEMFGDLLDEFAKDRFGIELNKNKNNKMNHLKKVFDSTNMESTFGSKKYNNFIDSLRNIKDERMVAILNKFGPDIKFESSATKSFAKGNTVHLLDDSFTDNNKYMQTVFHEIGHAIDSLGTKVLGTDFNYLSEVPFFRLRTTIEKDLINQFNKDMSEKHGDKYKPIKTFKKMNIFDEGAFVNKYKKLYNENPEIYSALSDMMESTGAFVEAPLGSGHGKKYWKTRGNQEAEFFAHVTEMMTNPEGRQMLNDIFPQSVKKYDEIINELLKGG